MGFLDDLPDLGFGGPPPKRRKPPAAPAPDKEKVDCVPWTSVRCPKCGSGNCPVVDSHNIPIRWHLCACGHRFKSLEQNYCPPGGA